MVMLEVGVGLVLETNVMEGLVGTGEKVGTLLGTGPKVGLVGLAGTGAKVGLMGPGLISLMTLSPVMKEGKVGAGFISLQYMT